METDSVRYQLIISLNTSNHPKIKFCIHLEVKYTHLCASFSFDMCLSSSNKALSGRGGGAYKFGNSDKVRVVSEA